MSNAAIELGVFSLLEESGNLPAGEIATRLALPQRRLERLLDVLVAENVLSHPPASEGYALPAAGPPELADSSAGEWDRIADVIVSDSPLALKPDWLGGHLQYVAERGAASAPWVWDAVQPTPGTRLLDVGGGLGAYSLAFVDRHERNTSTVLDLDEVCDLAKRLEVTFRPRLVYEAGDAREMKRNNGYDHVLLANVLHLFGSEDCRKAIRSATAALAPGGKLTIVDLYVSPNRREPLSSVYFALNMALFTSEGDVHQIPLLENWLEEAGLVNVELLSVEGLESTAVLVATKQQG